MNQINSPLIITVVVNTIATSPGRVPATTTVRNQRGEPRRAPSTVLPGSDRLNVSTQCPAHTTPPVMAMMTQNAMSIDEVNVSSNAAS